MGTSGAYGGSGSQAWDKVRERLDDLPVSEPSAGDEAGATSDSSADADDTTLAGLASALGDALAGEDTALTSTPQPFTLPDLIRRRGSGGGGGEGGPNVGGIRGESSRTGRTGGHSRRSVVPSAARGGVAIGGAYALRSGNRQALAEIELDLDELRTLRPRSQCARILDAVLGEAGHPDEMALRTAAAQQIKAIIMLETPPTEANALRGFIAAFVFQMGLVELRADLAKGVIDATTAVRKEGRLRRYLEKRASELKIPTSGTMRIADFRAHASRLVREAIGLLRAR